MDGIHEVTGSIPVSSTNLRCYAASSGKPVVFDLKIPWLLPVFYMK
jgi:hypothetical protein